MEERFEEKPLVTKQLAIKYLKAGAITAMSYELFKYIPISTVFSKNAKFIIGFIILRVATLLGSF